VRITKYPTEKIKKSNNTKNPTVVKKTIKINLSGVIFNIDEDAYEKLKRYLDAIGRHFTGKDEGKEILNDIESRIAELFREKRPREEEVITIALVTEVIEIMGDPEEIINTGEASTAGSAGPKSTSTTGGSRRLYRDPENSVFGGVCGGLGAYFNIDPIIIRILFVVLFFLGGASVLVYIILWIVIPKAQTAAQKLEMRGEPVTVSNIEKKIREEYESAKENVKAAAKSEPVKKTKKAAGDFFSEVGKVLLVFIKVILILIGTGFVLAGIGVIIGIVTGAFIGMQVFPFPEYSFSLGELLTPFSDPLSITLLIISLTLLFLIPVIAMIYGLIKLIFAIRTKNSGLTIGATLLWVVSLFMTIGILAMETGNYSNSGFSKTENQININSDTLFVSINESQKKEFNRNNKFNVDFDREWFVTEDLDRIYGQIELDIERSDDAFFMLEINKRSKGRNREDATTRAVNLNYNFVTNSNKLVLNPYFFLEGDEKWRIPRVELTLEVPVGKFVHLEKETREILEHANNVDQTSAWRMSGKTWMMTEEGLKLSNE
jgi:phage shock protein PspC (stress-responsive transcriptional regulator)